MCVCIVYVLPCRSAHFKNIVHSMCAMDFLTNVINIYITCPHSSLFYFLFFSFPIFRSTFYYIVSWIRGLSLSLPLAFGFLCTFLSFIFSRTSLIQAFFRSKLLSVLELLMFVVVVVVAAGVSLVRKVRWRNLISLFNFN